VQFLRSIKEEGRLINLDYDALLMCDVD